MRDAVAIVLRDDAPWSIEIRLAARGAAGWRALGDDLRAALLQQARRLCARSGLERAAAAPRAAAVEAASSQPSIAARLIGRIGAAAWRAADPALRETLMNAVLRDPPWIAVTAPAWPGMTDDERDALRAGGDHAGRCSGVAQPA